MQRLIAICFGNGDVIFKATWDRREVIVRRTEGAITGVDTVNNNPKSIQIHDVSKAFLLLFHLHVDAVEVLFSANYPSFYAFLLKAIFNAGLQGRENFFAMAARIIDRFGN